MMMRPLETVYWLRLVFGILAALVCVGYAVGTNAISPTEFSLNVFLNSTSLAIIFYLLTYYYVKYKFKPLVQKSQKLLTTGIGIYFLSWIVLWTLVYTILAGKP
jgi:hypothetical protein